MSEEEAFLQAIRGEPDEPAHRLVYADWLEERGDPRAEYLRLGAQVAQAQARMRQLEEGFSPEWVASVRQGRFRWMDIKLRSGRDIHLRRLDQHHIYEGLLEGLPTTAMNRRIIEGIVNDARTRRGEEPFLIRPRETPISYSGDRPYPFGDPAELPGVACVGRFTSFTAARGGGDCSELVVIWFQDEFALPIASEAWEQLVAIDWNQHAIDGSY
jgi:uncharacterized protein (TIGR02996 family)